MKHKVNVAVAGLGGRGRYLLKTLYGMPDVHIAVACDLREDLAARGADECAADGGYMPDISGDYEQVLSRGDIDAVVIASSWEAHVPMAIRAMEAGKYAAFEVGGACSVQQCWQLIETYERTHIPCMMLENCCYGETETALLNMVRQNVFGELINLECGYRHDLRAHIAKGIELAVSGPEHGLSVCPGTNNMRTRHNLLRMGDLYPTHGVGPMAKILDINRGNRFVSLTSTATKSAGHKAWMKENLPPDSPLVDTVMVNGDVSTTVIKCTRGEVLTVVHDTALPRPYSRGGVVQGTKGIWTEDGNHIHIEGISKEEEWEDFKPYMEKYRHPIWKRYNEGGIDVGGHGSMDYFILRAFVESVISGADTPIDAYDAAAWLAVTPLSEESQATGSAPVAFPDFTNGYFVCPAPAGTSAYCLD